MIKILILIINIKFLIALSRMQMLKSNYTFNLKREQVEP